MGTISEGKEQIDVTAMDDSNKNLDSEQVGEKVEVEQAEEVVVELESDEKVVSEEKIEEKLESPVEETKEISQTQEESLFNKEPSIHSDMHISVPKILSTDDTDGVKSITIHKS